MEEGEKKLEQAEMEETTQLVRKSRNGDDREVVAVSAVDGEVSDGDSEKEGMMEKIEERDRFLENESEFMNGEQKIEREVILEIEPEAINRELKQRNIIFHGVNSSSSIEEQILSYEPWKEIESAEIDEEDLEIADPDVERVIQKQTTHDLYCPNCKSCITKRVVLRKRKRRTRIPDEYFKRNGEVGLKLGDVSAQSPGDQEGGVGIHDAQETDMFRCLSCFSFFIPTGEGFMLFKKNWIAEMFTPNKQGTEVEQDVFPDDQQMGSRSREEDHSNRDNGSLIVKNMEEVNSPNQTVQGEGLDAPAAEGNDTVITIDGQPPALSPIAEGKVEVIKSIVYGGLAESITSLSVVSSAVGGGAATLNVLALGAANLIGGLFVISHNLWDLRSDLDDEASTDITEQNDRYRELLGRRQNFLLHAAVAIASYLMFGLVPPVVYGFSFRATDDEQLKLAAAAAASLVCILALAVAKAYVQKPPKPYLKVVLTFMILGFIASGISYAAGRLVEGVLERLGLFGPTSAGPDLLVQAVRPAGSGWASY